MGAAATQEAPEEKVICTDVIRTTSTPTKAKVKATIKQECIKEYKQEQKRARKRRERARKAKEKKQKQIDKYETYLLAKLIYCEVGAVEDTEVLYLCGSVALNRIKDKRFPNTLEGVIYQSGQWEVTWNGAFQSKEPDKRSWKVAKYLMKHGSIQKSINGMSEVCIGKFYKRFNNVVFYTV